MDARLDTLSDKLCQVNTRVSCITRWQAHMCGFVTSPSLSSSPQAFEDEDNGSGDDDDEEDEHASSSNNEEMIASQ